jgi:hypothetical protein
MPTQDDCRLLLGRSYGAAVRELERVAAGDDAALRSIQARCRELLERGTFARWHSSSIGPYVQRRWGEIVNGASRASAEAAQGVSEVFIALACMPEFQMAYEYGTEPSPNLVVLAESDGGLYDLLCDVDRWFNDLFIERFPRSPAKYAVGNAMIILDRADLGRLEKAIGKVTDEMCAKALAPDACRITRARLTSLVDRCLSLEDGMLAVSGSG